MKTSCLAPEENVKALTAAVAGSAGLVSSPLKLSSPEQTKEKKKKDFMCKSLLSELCFRTETSTMMMPVQRRYRHLCDELIHTYSFFF